MAYFTRKCRACEGSGYAGSLGDTCERCEGEGWEEVWKAPKGACPKCQDTGVVVYNYNLLRTCTCEGADQKREWWEQQV